MHETAANALLLIIRSHHGQHRRPPWEQFRRSLQEKETLRPGSGYDSKIAGKCRRREVTASSRYATPATLAGKLTDADEIGGSVIGSPS